MKKRFFLLIVFLVLLLCNTYTEFKSEEKQYNEVVSHPEIKAAVHPIEQERAIRIFFEFVVSFVFIFVALSHIVIKTVSFQYKHIRKKCKYRKQQPRSELAFSID